MLASALALLAVVYIPFMQSIFGTMPLAVEDLGIIVGVSLLIIVVAEVLKKTVPKLHN
jgi:hypothetical protein